MKNIKFIIVFLFFTLIFQPTLRADDISEFEIEGMSIGDSLLDYFSKEEIKRKFKDGKKYKDSKFIRLFFKEQNFNNYEYLSITIKYNDQEFIIHGIAGMFDEKNHDRCLDKKSNIKKDIKSSFPNAKIREWDKVSIQDKSGKSKIFGTSFDINSGTASVICYLFTEEANIQSGLDVSIKSKEFNDFLRVRTK